MFKFDNVFVKMFRYSKTNASVLKLVLRLAYMFIVKSFDTI